MTTTTRRTRQTFTIDGQAFSALPLKGDATYADWQRGQSGSSAGRRQKWLYALLVLSAVTGEAPSRYMTCPLTGERFDTFHDSEVDRLAGEGSAYAPGNVCLVSVKGNQGRAYAQQMETDCAGAAWYIATVERASETVTPLGGGNTSDTARAFAMHGARGDRHADRGHGYRIDALATIAAHMARMGRI